MTDYMKDPGDFVDMTVVARFACPQCRWQYPFPVPLNCRKCGFLIARDEVFRRANAGPWNRNGLHGSYNDFVSHAFIRCTDGMNEPTLVKVAPDVHGWIKDELERCATNPQPIRAMEIIRLFGATVHKDVGLAPGSIEFLRGDVILGRVEGFTAPEPEMRVIDVPHPDVDIQIALSNDITAEEGAQIMRQLGEGQTVALEVPKTVRTMGDFFSEETSRSFAEQAFDKIARICGRCGEAKAFVDAHGLCPECQRG
jgi:hypothetical protein